MPAGIQVGAVNEMFLHPVSHHSLVCASARLGDDGVRLVFYVAGSSNSLIYQRAGEGLLGMPR